MIGSHFNFFTPGQIDHLKNNVFDLLGNHGVKLDPHPEMFDALAKAGVTVDPKTNMVRFPKANLERSIDQAPKKFVLGARGKDRVLELPRPDGTFYARTNTGAHGWIDPETDHYRKVLSRDLAGWAKLINRLDDIHFIPFLFCDDVPTETADIHGLSLLLKNTDKHIWVQPYSAPSVEYLIKLGTVAAGGLTSLEANPVISMIACSLAPRAFKHMDIEIILQSAKVSLPIHACSLPGAGGTAPATMPGVIVMAAAEILAMVAMAQAVKPGTPVVACPIIFSTDMRTGRSLQSSVEALKGASGAVQFIKAAFNLPTHNYGSGSDAPTVDEQSLSERAMLTTLMGLSGSDILGGAGQLEVATAVSPIQLIVDNEVIGMVRRVAAGFEINDDTLAWDVLTKGKPGDHFLTTPHTLRHCRDAFVPQTFTRLTREGWERQGSKAFLERVIERYRELMGAENLCRMADEQAREIDSVVSAADKKLVP
jgi:trimethylamine:corrinoid methyltransferase-like protein